MCAEITDIIWDGIKQHMKDFRVKRRESKQLRKVFDENANCYFKEKFCNLSHNQEFDFQSLNKFLRKNIESRIIACLYISNSNEQEQLIRESYTRARADSDEKKRIVFHYVTNILNVIKEVSLQKVDKSQKILMLDTAEQTSKNIASKLDESSQKNQDFINYHGSFAELVDSINPPGSSTNQYHYLNSRINFQGRENDIVYLDAFLNADDKFLISVIVGQGGIGKSKLMKHYMDQKIFDLDWKFVYPGKPWVTKFVENCTEWKYPKNLFIILDYAGELPEIIGKWIGLLSGTSARPQKIRILMLERQGKTTGTDNRNEFPEWYKCIDKASNYNMSALLYNKDFYRLEPLNTENYLSLIDNIACNNGKSIPSDMKNDIYEHTKNMGNSGDNRFLTPLIIILLTDAVLDGKELGTLNAEQLMTFIIRKHKNHWENVICSGNSELYQSLCKLIVYATATGGWDLNILESPMTEDSSLVLDSFNLTSLHNCLSSLNGNDECKRLLPLEPDIVGEYFVLDFLLENKGKTYFRQLIELLWSKPSEFSSFLFRCTDSYLCNDRFRDMIFSGTNIFDFDNAPLGTASVLVNLSANFFGNDRKSIVEMLLILAERYADNQVIVLRYAKGLVNLSAKQALKERIVTVEKLCAIAEDKRYSNNQEIVLRYAMGLVNLSAKQELKERAGTVNLLCKLTDRYPNNQEIVMRYAKGLVNLSEVQAPEEKTKTFEKLRTLSERYPDNQEIRELLDDLLK